MDRVTDCIRESDAKANFVRRSGLEAGGGRQVRIQSAIGKKDDF